MIETISVSVSLSILSYIITVYRILDVNVWPWRVICKLILMTENVNRVSCSYVSKTENQCYNWFKVEGQSSLVPTFFFTSTTDLEWRLRLHKPACNMTVVVAVWCSGCVLVYWLWGPSPVQPRHIFLFQTEAALPPLPQARGRWTGAVWAGWRWLGLVVVVGPGLGLDWIWESRARLGPGLPHRGAAVVQRHSVRRTLPHQSDPSQVSKQDKENTRPALLPTTLHTTLHTLLNMVDRQTQADSGLTTSKKIVVAIQLFTPSLSVKINAAKSSYFPQSGVRRAATL